MLPIRCRTMKRGPDARGRQPAAPPRSHRPAMRCEARDRALAPTANCASFLSAPITPDVQDHSLAGALRMAQLHAPVKCGKATIAGRLVEHRVALGGDGKRLGVA